MSQAKTNPLIRVFPSLTDLAFLMPIIFLFVRMDGAKSMLGDGDTGWHVRTGEWILAHHSVPRADMFSFTKAGEPWYAWEWLWDVLFALVHQHGGLGAVVTASIFVLCVTFALLFLLVRRHCQNPFLAAAATFIACVGSSLHWLARPHLFSLLFLVILLWVLQEVEAGRTRLLLALPLLTILWTNLHGGFVILFLVLGAFCAGELIRAALTDRPSERGLALSSARRLFATGCLCAAATLANPYGIRLHQHIYQYFSEPYHLQNIAEFQSMSFHHGAAMFFEITLLFGVLSALWFIVQHRNFTPAALVLGWAHLALFSVRNVPLLAIVVAPLAAQALDEFFHRLSLAPVAGWLKTGVRHFEAIAREFSETDRLWRLHLVSAGAIVILALLISNPLASGKLKAEYDVQKYPAQALAELRSQPDARIFADDEWGDYLIYHLYPRQKVFVDGRSDFYGQDFEQAYFDFINVRYDWEQYLQKFGIDAVVLSTKSALACVMKESPNWRAVHDDQVSIVFRPATNRTYPGFPIQSRVEKRRDLRIAHARDVIPGSPRT